MKECPVCGDTFGDDLNFCDVDGSRLNRQKGSAPSATQNKIWSMLGIALLIGGLVISAITILFLPRSRTTPTIISSEPAAPPKSSSPTQSTQPPAAENTVPAPPAEEPLAAADRSSLELKRRDKPVVESTTDAHSASAKEAAQGSEHAPQPAPEPVKAQPAPAHPETAATKPAQPASENNSPKSTQPAADQSKTQAAKPKDASKEQDSKKDDKKKGGFFRAFKKIFGKN
jgi:FtsZ-interacting cell division protein ZipA